MSSDWRRFYENLFQNYPLKTILLELNKLKKSETNSKKIKNLSFILLTEIEQILQLNFNYMHDLQFSRKGNAEKYSMGLFCRANNIQLDSEELSLLDSLKPPEINNKKSKNEDPTSKRFSCKVKGIVTTTAIFFNNDQ